MNLKEELKNILKISGLAIIKILAISIMIASVMYELYWITAITIIILDLTPSYIKVIWRYFGHSLRR